MTTQSTLKIQRTNFSVIIPYYKGELHYERLLKSLLFAFRNLKNYNFEVFTIIDSMETDIELIQQINYMYFKESLNVQTLVFKNAKNLGVAGSRNFALSKISGDYIHLIDQDDEVESSFYEVSSLYLVSYNFILFNGIMKYNSIKYSDHKIYYIGPNLELKYLIIDDFIRSPGQVLFHKTLLQNISFPETKYKGSDDKYFWIKLFTLNLNNISPIYVRKPLYVAQIHDLNYSHDRINMVNSCLENWSLFDKTILKDNYKKYVNQDIQRLSFKLNKNIKIKDKLFALYFEFKFKFKLNKVLRFLIKRRKIL